ncbi:MAG: alpha-glucan phosphorylase [Bacteroidetes bacterium]|nr:alpha-glucan phosphorylase [Bacteroidota bacterium]
MSIRMHCFLWNFRQFFRILTHAKTVQPQSSAKAFVSNSSHQPFAERLQILARNLWWTWNPQAQEIFRELSPLTWERSNHSAIDVLHEVSHTELAARLHDSDFQKKVHRVLEEFESYMQTGDTWASRHPQKLMQPVAYFSAEFGLHESLPIYSGGLGVLSGDHTKSASDLGIPFIGLSLFYRNGYFQQHLGPDGWQEESYPLYDPVRLPLELVTREEGGRLLNSVEIGHSTVYFQAWRLRVGRAFIYLLDTNLPENDRHFQGLTGHVYGGDVDTRIGQEIVLGIGGVRFLRSMGIEPSVFHMNEGHSAFLTLELLREQLKQGKNLEQAQKSVSARCIFTTHTPVPAGHDRFSAEHLHDTLGRFWNDTGLTGEQLMSYGRIDPSDRQEMFTMTVMALKMSRSANGVSELHGQVSREMWKELYPEKALRDVPIGHITNGIHTPSWATAKAHEFWNKRIGVDWTAKLMDSQFWGKMENGEIATDGELWALRYALRRDLVEFVRQRLRGQFARTEGEHSSIDRTLSSDTLTICFARRFATYKRAPLVFRKLDDIISLVNDPNRPIQFVFAGKAHPRDHEGKRYMQSIIEMTRHPQLVGKVVFVENYDMNVARHLISGADVWLNTPRRPLEASGTSGQKTVIHGGLNFSIMDGWWPEGYNGTNGWSIGDDTAESDLGLQDDKDFDSLFRTLTERVIPEFYDRNAQGIPEAWIKHIRSAMHSLVPVYNTDRMVAEYFNEYYSRPQHS